MMEHWMRICGQSPWRRGLLRPESGVFSILVMLDIPFQKNRFPLFFRFSPTEKERHSYEGQTTNAVLHEYHRTSVRCPDPQGRSYEPCGGRSLSCANHYVQHLWRAVYSASQMVLPCSHVLFTLHEQPRFPYHRRSLRWSCGTISRYIVGGLGA